MAGYLIYTCYNNRFARYSRYEPSWFFTRAPGVYEWIIASCKSSGSPATTDDYRWAGYF